MRNYNFSVIAIYIIFRAFLLLIQLLLIRRRDIIFQHCVNQAIIQSDAHAQSIIPPCVHVATWSFPRVRPEIKYSPLSVVCICYTSISWLFLLLHLSENFTILSSSLSLSLSLYISLSLFLSYYLSLSLHIWGSSMWPLHS